MKKTKKRTVIKNKRRFTAFLVVVIALCCCGFTSVKNYVFAERQTSAISVFVSEGDTLWTIAAENNPENEDIRTVVHRIKKYNKITSNTIYCGEEIFIPTR